MMNGNHPPKSKMIGSRIEESMLLIGSHALKYYIEISREPKDYDVICTYSEFEDWIKSLKPDKPDLCYPINKGKTIVVKKEKYIFEFEIAWENSSAADILEISKTQSLDKITLPIASSEVRIAHPYTLYALKISHRYLKNSPHFNKTLSDIKIIRKYGFGIIPESLKDWLVKREKETYTYDHPNLNQSKSDFFDPNQGINYVYDHDSIHEAMKHLDKPAYSYFKEDDKEVKCSKEKFQKLPYITQIYSVLEEVYVLALERSQIPFRGLVDPKRSFLLALEKVCTSITSGWWREFAWENYNVILQHYNPEYVEKFWEAERKGLIKLYEKKLAGANK